MSDDPPAADTLAAAHAHLAEALATLAALGIPVTITGEPARYEVDGQRMSEGEVVAYALRLAGSRTGRGQ